MRSNISNIIKAGIRLAGLSSDKQFLNYFKPARDTEELAREQRVERETLVRLERYMETSAA